MGGILIRSVNRNAEQSPTGDVMVCKESHPVDEENLGVSSTEPRLLRIRNEQLLLIVVGGVGIGTHQY